MQGLGSVRRGVHDVTIFASVVRGMQSSTGGVEAGGHLLGAGLASAPAADKVYGRGALGDALHIRLVEVVQLVGQAIALRLLAPSLQPTPILSNGPNLLTLYGVILSKVHAMASAAIKSLVEQTDGWSPITAASYLVKQRVSRIIGAREVATERAHRLVLEGKVVCPNLVAGRAVQRHRTLVHHHPLICVAAHHLLRRVVCTHALSITVSFGNIT